MENPILLIQNRYKYLFTNIQVFEKFLELESGEYFLIFTVNRQKRQYHFDLITSIRYLSRTNIEIGLSANEYQESTFSFRGSTNELEEFVKIIKKHKPDLKVDEEQKSFYLEPELKGAIGGVGLSMAFIAFAILLVLYLSKK